MSHWVTATISLGEASEVMLVTAILFTHFLRARQFTLNNHRILEHLREQPK